MSTKMMIFSAGSTPDRCRLETLLILSRPFSAPHVRDDSTQLASLVKTQVQVQVKKHSVTHR
jgi:hypothetical protein